MRIHGGFAGVFLTPTLRGPRREVWLQVDQPLRVTGQARIQSRWYDLWTLDGQEAGALLKGETVRVRVEGTATGVLEVW